MSEKFENSSTIDRRSILKGIAATSALGILGSGNAFSATGFGTYNNSQNTIGPVKITKIESVRFSDKIKIGGGSGGSGGAEFCWVRLHTDKGVIGTGETYPFSNGELGALKDYARLIIGKDPRDIDGLWKRIFHDMSMRNAGGADMRVLSA
ncbi:MAG: hypothetical protein Q8S11_08245, partial [Daejeonella sp.]|uniref:hypothetical protein n=1 Tax=Daejeonella sp. TaxID=2805397 RepID=UPI00276440CA|nr:hypothetical protein [Daejeonella sp.]